MSGVLIDASNLNTGGGVQVAASLITELADLRREGDPIVPSDLTIEISQAVADNCRPEAISDLSCRVANRSPFKATRWKPAQVTFDVTFTVFGPEYGAPRGRRRIVGFADVTSVYPHPKELPSPDVVTRGRRAVRGMVSRKLTSRADHIVVETTALKSRLVTRGVGSAEAITVVPNTYHRIFDRPKDWTPLHILPPRLPSARRLAYVTRGYPHKNLPFLADVAAHAQARHGMVLDFILTLTAAEWHGLPAELRGVSTNVGPIRIDQVPNVYRAADAAIFPSLLEAFSAMPIEAMRMDLPVLASDRDFVRAVAQDGATYFDPGDSAAAANVICAFLANDERRSVQILRGRQRAANLPTARARATAYLQLIQRERDLAL